MPREFIAAAPLPELLAGLLLPQLVAQPAVVSLPTASVSIAVRRPAAGGASRGGERSSDGPRSSSGGRGSGSAPSGSAVEEEKAAAAEEEEEEEDLAVAEVRAPAQDVSLHEGQLRVLAPPPFPIPPPDPAPPPLGTSSEPSLA